MPFRLRPTYIIDHVTDINLEDIKELGVKGFIFDLDNTLMAPKTGVLTDDVYVWLEKVKSQFKVAIVSNNNNVEYVQKVRKVFDFPLYAAAQKPRNHVILRALRDMDLLPSQVAMVGDQVLTDMLVGQRTGMYTILVDPLVKHKEIPLYKFLRKLERSIVSKATRQFSEIKKY